MNAVLCLYFYFEEALVRVTLHMSEGVVCLDFRPVAPLNPRAIGMLTFSCL